MNIAEYQNYHERKSHTDMNFPYNTYLCSMPLDFTVVPLHWHDEIELIVIKKGQGYVSVDFETRTVTAGDMVFVLPGQLHSIEQRAENVMEYENIIFKPEILITKGNDYCADKFISPMLRAECSVLTFITPSCTDYPCLLGCISHIDQLCAARPKGYQLALKGYLFQFFFLLISAQGNKEPLQKARQKPLKKLKILLKYVEEHYAEPITVEKMADVVFYSKSHFMKFFKIHMGTGFIEYLNDYRLTMAARLLVTTEDSILEIASQTGFDNLSYFNRLFRRKYAQTPGQYRKAASS
ncbi:helix-turn-helix transcriptional regulator [Clostridium sp. C105KSO13]|uniref:helix-turn-helix transcriptional regulator n=1 Tax=Clostridium sp. C105KSO13 TaxID=1776045 RepID=UPI00074085E5|nr:AraC family transcriptional regulator [Clostridium sp. C105KSO13]CUX30712.1 HTH-type transcriptional activator RhaS [Clostridium sp. C105KSO13]